MHLLTKIYTSLTCGFDKPKAPTFRTDLWRRDSLKKIIGCFHNTNAAGKLWVMLVHSICLFVFKWLVLKQPTFLLVHNISILYFLNIKFYKLFLWKHKHIILKGQSETELISEVLTKDRQNWSYSYKTPLEIRCIFKQAAIHCPVKGFF